MYLKVFVVLMLSVWVSGIVTAQQFTDMSVNDLDGETGFRTQGQNEGDWLGSRVSDAGDVNNDGFDDIAVSALKHDGGAENAGAVYVIFGSDQGFDATLDLSALNGSNGFVIMGEAKEDRFGFSISNVGDLNHDGVNELAITAYEAETPGLVDNGITYVMFGRQSYPPVVSLSTFNGTNGGFTIHGKFAGDRASDVSEAGDFNGDGIDDLIVGTQAHDPGVTNAGAAYVVFGTNQGFPGILDLGDIDGTNGVAFWGENGGDLAGNQVSGAGDFDGDGTGDVMITAFNESTNGASSGAVYVVYGNRGLWPAAISLDQLTGRNGFKLMGEESLNYLGLSISGAGDFNDDGKDDIMMGAHFTNVDTTVYHKVYVVFGRDDSMAASYVIDTVADLEIKTTPTSYHSYYNYDSGYVGDLNGDGITDLALADPYRDDEIVIDGTVYVMDNNGAVYVVYGAKTFESNEILTDQMAENEGFMIRGGWWSDNLGRAISAAGDVNHDGLDDLLLGVTRPDFYAGESYVVYGNDVIFSDGYN